MASGVENITKIPDSFDGSFRVRLGEVEYQRYLESTLRHAQIRGSIPAENVSPVGADLNNFFPLVQDALASRQQTEAVPEDKRIQLLEEDPPEAVDTEMITVALEGRFPGQMNQGPAGDSRIKEVNPHHRSIVDHPEHPSEKLVTMGRFYDNWLNFYIYAATNKAARNRLLWFGKLMDGYNWYFRLYHFRVIEDNTSARERVEIDGRILTRYTTTYLVRTDDTFHYGTQELKRLILNADVQR
jgi:hypothetical protein